QAAGLFVRRGRTYWRTNPRVHSSINAGIGRAEDAGRAVFPNPGVLHPIRLGDEPTALLLAVRPVHLHSHVSVGIETEIGVFVPGGERVRKRAGNRLAIGSGGSGKEIAHTDEPQCARRALVLLIEQDRWTLDVKSAKPPSIVHIVKSHAGHIGSVGAISICL